MTAVLVHTGDGKNIKRLFYAPLYTLMVSQLVPKHVGVDSGR